MSNLVNESADEQPIGRFAIPVRYGLMAGFISMFLTTINFLYLLNISYPAFMVGGFLMFAAPIVFYVLVIKRQKNLLGGYISLKEGFQAVFVVVLISSSIATIYGLIYNNYIDPQFVTRMKSVMENFFIKSKLPSEKIDEILSNVDSATAGAKSISKTLYGFAQGIIMQSLIGFIIALILKKEKSVVQ